MSLSKGDQMMIMMMMMVMVTMPIMTTRMMTTIIMTIIFPLRQVHVGAQCMSMLEPRGAHLSEEV